MNKVILSENERKKLQKIEQDALEEIDRICKVHNITYTLAYGTLLGAA